MYIIEQDESIQLFENETVASRHIPPPRMSEPKNCRGRNLFIHTSSGWI